jgi:NADPH:quinone reductase-like Zn-dependent oxidoreductase
VTRFGGYADVVLLSPGLAVPTPDEVPDHVAAALPVNGLTAHHMVHRVCAVRSGETVLIHGAAGGVGTIAVQLCRRAGARVIGTASPSKHDLLKEEGVEPVDSRAADWAERVRALTDGRGVDVALDPIGGSHLRGSYGLLRPAGRLCAFGVQEMSAGRGSVRRLWTAVKTLVGMPWFHPVKLMNENRSVGGVNLGRLWDETGLLAPQLRTVTGLAASGELRPVIDSVFALDRAGDAHRRLESRESAGKILLKAGVDEGTDYPSRGGRR